MRSALRRKAIIAITTSSASSPSRSRIVKAPRKVDDAALGFGRERRFGLVEQCFGVGQPRAELGRGLAASDRGAEAGHRLLDLGHQRAVARGEHRLDRLEPVEIGGQGELAWRASRSPRCIGGEAFAQPVAGELQRRAGLPPGISALGVGAQDRRSRAAALLGTDLRFELGRGHRDERGEVGDRCADRRVVAPDALARARRRR